MLGSVCRLKRFHLGGKRFTDDEEVDVEVQKWPRQQSKDFYAVGFDALAKRSDKCIKVSGGPYGPPWPVTGITLPLFLCD
jgi:hypothetical protein